MMYLANTTQAVNLRDIKKHHENVFFYQRLDTLVSIGAYCLMPNHFHILLTPVLEHGVSLFMNKLTTSYTMYFNKRYERTGSLFQGVFKSQHADIDEYLKYLYAYIHLNPVKLIDKDWKERGSKDAAKSFDFAASYVHSSLPEYLGVSRPENKIIDPAPFPEYFTSASDHRSELFEWLTNQEFITQS
jgi:putative transposase